MYFLSTVRSYQRNLNHWELYIIFGIFAGKLNGFLELFQVKLERVIGLTVSSNAALDCDPETEMVAYPAG